MSSEAERMSSAMPNCREIEDNLAAYIDGEPTTVESGTIDIHLKACPACARRAVAERAARELVCSHRQRLRGCAPGDLRQRCAALRANARVPARRRYWVPVSLAASLLLVAGVLFIFVWGSGVETYAAQLAVDHVKCFQYPPEASAPVDATLMGRTWQEANGWSLKVAASSPDDQLQLIGIRRCGSTKGRVAHIFYKWRDQPLSVYVLNGTVDRAAESVSGHDHYEPVARFGENTIIWFGRGRTYAVVSRAPLADLQRVAGYVRRAIE
jgi:anti-sigma factor RsiW